MQGKGMGYHRLVGILTSSKVCAYEAGAIVVVSSVEVAAT
jgi:hypothetical protein